MQDRKGHEQTAHNSRSERVSGQYFSYFSMKTYFVGTHQKRLCEALLMSTTIYVFVKK